MMDSMSFIENLLARKGEFCLTTFASYEADEVLKTACAFLNNRGGWIVVGIDKGKKLTSVDVKAVVKDIQIRAISQIKPLPLLYVHEEKYQEGNVVLVTVMKGGLPPYSYNGRYYVEQGYSVLEPDRDDISILMRESSLVSNWEQATHLNAEWEDLDGELMTKVVKAGHDKNRLDAKTKDAESLLGSLGLKDVNYVKNGAVALFGTEADTLLRQCQLRIQVMLGGKAANRYEDTCTLRGNLFSLLDQTHDYFEHRLPVASAFSDVEWDRKSGEAFPLDVVEAITNALIHRDFSDVSGEVLVYIYHDRMEIDNPGEMPKDLVRRKTEATAKKDLALMLAQKLCRKEGAGPSSRYVVLEKK